MLELHAFHLHCHDTHSVFTLTVPLHFQRIVLTVPCSMHALQCLAHGRLMPILPLCLLLQSLLRKYLEFEKAHGTPEGEQQVKLKAMEYVQRRVVGGPGQESGS